MSRAQHKDPQAAPAAASATPTAPGATAAQRTPLPLVLRTDKSVYLSVYYEPGSDGAPEGALKQLDNGTSGGNGGNNNNNNNNNNANAKNSADTVYTGDYTACEVCFHPTNGRVFAHASADHLRCSEVTASSDAAGPTSYGLRTLFDAPVDHVITRMAFSPRGTYLVTYAVPDRKRLPAGNLCVYRAADGVLLSRFMQARWPALVWTADEEFAARPVQNFLHILAGEVGAADAGADGSSGGDAEEGEEDEEARESGEEGGGARAARAGVLAKLDMMVGQECEIALAASPASADDGGLPLLALFKPFHKGRQAEVAVFRLPDVSTHNGGNGPVFRFFLARAESARLSWSGDGQHLAVLAQSDRDRSGKSYYGTAALHLVDVPARAAKELKVNKAPGEAVHDFMWAPRVTGGGGAVRRPGTELLVVHGAMPRNKATLFSKKGVALLTLGEAPRNMAAWAPDGRAFVLGGTGNMAGDWAFYRYTPGGAAGGSRAGGGGGNQQQPAATCVGEINEKCSFQTWAPDSHNFLCATVFTRLRVDNKLVFTKTNGARALTVRFPILYGAHWVPTLLRPPTAAEAKEAEEAEAAPRPDSPRPAGEQKPKKYVPPGGTSVRAAAALGRPDPSGAQAAKPAGPIGGVVAAPRKKRKR